MKTYLLHNTGYLKGTLIYFEWIYISILPPPIFMVLGGGGGEVKMFLSILNRGRGEEMLCFNINPYLVRLLERYTFQKPHKA